MKITTILSLFLSLALVSGCATSGVNRGDVNLVSLSEEWQMGQQFEQQLAKDLKLVNDRATVAYVSRIGQQLVSQTELRNQPWEFHVVADPAINAFNIPGGHVYVNTGLLAAVDNAAELAGVMAHEIAHGVSRHGTERLTKAYGLNIGAGLLLGQDPSTTQKILAQLVGGGALAKFSRSDERESDELGVLYMYRAGYDPEGMATMFEKLLSQRKSRPSAVQSFFSSHPLTESRIAAVRAEARQLPPKRGLTTRDGELASVQSRVGRYNR